MRPKAIYIMLPVEPGDSIDSTPWNVAPPLSGLQGGTHPNGDETTNNDGWAAFSGTSAAAPQLAGVAALIKQACPGLTPVQVRNIMKSTARDVTAGNANSVPGGPAGGHPATVGPDLATGNGLANVTLVDVGSSPTTSNGGTYAPGVACQNVVNGAVGFVGVGAVR